MFNQITVIGRLGKDPEIRTAQSSDTRIAKFSVAVDRGRKDRNGEKQTDWFNVAVFGRTVEFVEQYCHKGDLVCVSGRCQIDEFTDRDGNKRTWVEINTNEIQKLSWDNDNEGGSDRGGRGRDNDRGSRGGSGGGRDRDFDRDLDDRDRDSRRDSGGRGSRRAEPAKDDDEFTNDNDDPFAEPQGKYRD